MPIIYDNIRISKWFILSIVLIRYQLTNQALHVSLYTCKRGKLADLSNCSDNEVISLTPMHCKIHVGYTKRG